MARKHSPGHVVPPPAPALWVPPVPPVLFVPPMLLVPPVWLLPAAPALVMVPACALPAVALPALAPPLGMPALPSEPRMLPSSVQAAKATGAASKNSTSRPNGAGARLAPDGRGVLDGVEGRIAILSQCFDDTKWTNPRA